MGSAMNDDAISKAFQAVSVMSEQLAVLQGALARLMPPEAQRVTKERPQKASPTNKYAVASSLSADLLGPTPNVDSDAWPLAVPVHMIVNNDDPMIKQFRAIQVIGIMGVPLSGLRVLDFGCGDGYISQEMAATSDRVVGYDTKTHKYWSNHKAGNLTLTTDINEVTANAPYDLILGYDVFDHLENADLDNAVKFIHNSLTADGRAFFRFHPWTARHGSHLYDKLNKAFVHLVLTPDELAQRGLIPEYNVKIVRPVATYDSLITKNNFSILKRKGYTEEVESFFDDNLVERINKVCYRGKADKEAIKKIMGLQFIDYTVKKSI